MVTQYQAVSPGNRDTYIQATSNDSAGYIICRFIHTCVLTRVKKEFMSLKRSKWGMGGVGRRKGKENMMQLYLN